jgi:hypothetical protein
MIHHPRLQLSELRQSFIIAIFIFPSAAISRIAKETLFYINSAARTASAPNRKSLLHNSPYHHNHPEVSPKSPPLFQRPLKA